MVVSACQVSGQGSCHASLEHGMFSKISLYLLDAHHLATQFQLRPTYPGLSGLAAVSHELSITACTALAAALTRLLLGMQDLCAHCDSGRDTPPARKKQAVSVSQARWGGHRHACPRGGGGFLCVALVLDVCCALHVPPQPLGGGVVQARLARENGGLRRIRGGLSSEVDGGSGRNWMQFPKLPSIQGKRGRKSFPVRQVGQ